MVTGKQRLDYAFEFEPGSALARLVGLISEGVVQSQVEAAGKLGVSKQRIHQLVEDYGLSLKRQPLTVPVVCSVY